MNNRIMLAGTGSGCGKTTITCGLLGALKKKGLSVSSFKSGPDYIDTMFHGKVLGINSNNLDIFLCGENGVKNILKERGKDVDISVIEGVMGLYDGYGEDDLYSTNHLSLLTDTPVILVVSPKGMSLSLAAIISGYKNFRKNNIVGVILNNVSKGMYEFYKNIVEKETSLEVLGYLPPDNRFVIGSRHLGLITAEEITDLKEKMELLAEICTETLNLNRIIEISKNQKEIEANPICLNKIDHVRVALAWDKAFCFYYEENIKILEKLGAEIIRFSPIEDKKLPDNIHGLILPGGYPELYLDKLSQNKTMLSDIKEKIENDLPTIAECGGYMYLCKKIDEYQMVGAIDSNSFMKNKLVRFGYSKLTALKNNILCDKGEVIKGHEFHYSDSTNNGDNFLIEKRKSSADGVHGNENLYAGYPHTHFAGNIKGAEKFIKKCVEMKNNGNHNNN